MNPFESVDVIVDYARQEAKRTGSAVVERIHVAMALAILLDYPADYAQLKARAMNPANVWPDLAEATPKPILELIDQCFDEIAASGVLKDLLSEIEQQQPLAVGGTGSTSAAGQARQLDIGPTVEDCLAELDALVGLADVKHQIHRLLASQRANALRVADGQPAVPLSLHLVFTGDPGTGKTTVARIVGQLYRASGLLPKGQLIETDRSDLVAGFVGQTAIKTREVLDAAMGGVLFIDEAYSLAGAGTQDFGAEAIATIVKAMEDHRDELAVIAAGYRDQMKLFVESNPGLRSRFKTFIDFPNYTPDELLQIFEALCSKKSFKLAPPVREAVHDRIKAEHMRESTGNARFVRSLFEEMFANMAMRADADGSLEIAELRGFHVSDVPPASGSSAGAPPVGFAP